MPLFANTQGKTPFDSINFDSATNEFNLTLSHTPSVEITINYPLTVQSSFNINDFQLILMHSTNYAENDIFQVYERDAGIRIGWVFPIRSLVSNNHDEASNIHFLRYAYVAFQKLLLNPENKTEFVSSENAALIEEDGIQERGLYDEETIVLILSNNQLSTIPNFDIKNYYPAFASQDYYTQKVKYNYSRTVTNQRLYVKSIAVQLRNESYLEELFEKLITENHPLVRFHVLYQVIELLIEKVLLFELTLIADKLKAKQIIARDVDQQIKKIQSEEKRIIRLFDDYTTTTSGNPARASIRTDLKTQCDILLNGVGKPNDTLQGAANSIYSVRNFVVHDYRNIPSALKTHLANINQKLFLFIVDALTYYIRPTN